MSDALTSKSEIEALAALQPAAVVGYLRGNGWEKSRDYGQNAAIFKTSVDEQESEIIVPIERQARDFTPVMDLLIRDLSKFEGRAASEVLSDLSIAGFDVIRVRSPEADEIGSVQLSAGVELHERARDMILYAANVAASGAGRASWRGRRFEEVDSYLSSLRLGQTQRGSFIISLLSRWEFTHEEEGMFASLIYDPFGRRVTRALGRALEATAAALRRAAIDQPLLAFAQAVEAGVSANLCQSLADIAQNGDGADISIRWSYTRPEPSLPLLRLRRDDVQILSEAARVLAESEPMPDVNLQGLVTQLKEDPRTFDGITMIEAPVDGNLRRVKVEFDANDTEVRDKLIDAFKERKRLSVAGELVKDGRRLRLNNPYDLVVLPAQESDEA